MSTAPVIEEAQMIGDRIKLARARKGYSLERLAREIGISRQAISKYELGKSRPSSGVLVRLAQALEVKPEFFVRSRTVDLGHVEFRRYRSRLTRSAEKAVLAEVSEWLERYAQVEEIVGAEARLRFDLPPPDRREVSKLGDVERVATAMRNHWQLGVDPIENVTVLLEDKGVKVNLVSADEGFDALQAEVAGSPVIVTRQGVPWDRQRFSLAHELGHLVLVPCQDLDPDKAADRFAAAFLVPEGAARFELHPDRSRLEPRELLLLKLKYGLSMQGWILRARDLGIVGQGAAASMLRAFRARGWHRREPGPVREAERPKRLELLVMQALAEDLLSESKAAELLGTSLWSLRTEAVAER
jgi:Zn-dependent peptidase ImmA (M78 family)